METAICNPYEHAEGTWVRGNFHGHCAESSRCASVPLLDAVDRYRRMGAAFTVFTDHDTVTELSHASSLYLDIVLFSGFEHSLGENLAIVGEGAAELTGIPLNEAMRRSNGLLTFACHPRPRPGEEHWSLEKLTRLPRFPDGIEIYNGHYGVPMLAARGCVPRYTDFWDELLTMGIRLWGFVNDDSHDPPDFGNAFDMVCVPRVTPAALIGAVKAGRFYGSTGLLPAVIEGRGGAIDVAFDGPCTGRFIGPGGVVLAESTGTGFTYTLTDETYVRFEAESGEGLVFLQPVHRLGDR